MNAFSCRSSRAALRGRRRPPGRRRPVVLSSTATLALVVCLAIVVSRAQAQPAPASPTSGPTASDAAPAAPIDVDFLRDIEPLFQSRCVACHGPDLQHGGLRLDDVSFAQQGGRSRAAVLGGAVHDNELIRRITASDIAVRMPKNAPPLSSDEIARLRAWVEQGSPWETPRRESDVEKSYDPPPRDVPLWETALDWFDRVASVIFPYVPLILVVALGIGFVERCQEWNRKRREAALAAGREPPAPRFRPLLAVTRSHYLNVVLTASLGVAVHRLWTRPPAERPDRTAASRSGPPAPSRNTEVRVSDMRFGSPPRPLRPRHPKRLEGVYYRGNCERSPQLYNGGNYLTASFRIRLCDAGGKPVGAGDEIPPDGLFVQLDLDRAPGTHPSFFTEETMKAVALTAQVFTNRPDRVTEPLSRLDVVKPHWSWTVRHPLGRPSPERPDRLPAIVYFSKGSLPAETEKTGDYAGQAHYAIVAELTLKDGRLTSESDLWMGSLFVVPALEFPTPGKVPLDEWFDFRPLPEIVGDNTTDDPKLLGLPPTDAPSTETPKTETPRSTTPEGGAPR